MGVKRRFLTASALAVMITALSVLLEPIGGELLMMPGIIANGITHVFLTMLLTEGDNFFHMPNGSQYVFNAIFYTFTIFIALSLYKLMKVPSSLTRVKE